MRLEVVAGGTRHMFSGDDLPLAVCRLPSGEIRILAHVSGQPLAWIQAHPNGLAFQPEGFHEDVRISGQTVATSTWIGNGQVLAVGQSEITIWIGGEDFRFDIADPVEAVVNSSEIDPAMAEQMARIGRRFSHGEIGARRRTHPAALTGGTLLSVLAAGGALILSVVPVDIRFSPEADDFSVGGTLPAIRFGGRYLAMPGEYVVEARKDGYRPIRATIQVARDSTALREFSFQKLGGILKVRVTPPVDASVQIDGIEKGHAPLDVDVDAGIRVVGVAAPKYLPEQTSIEIEGREQSQELLFALKPAWAKIRFASRPEGAEVRVDGEKVGQTPVDADVLQGSRKFEFSLPGWKTAGQMTQVQPGVELSLPTVELERADGTVQITTEPLGSTVAVNGEFKGQSPLVISQIGEREYQVTLSKTGYETVVRSLRIESEKSQRLNVRLEPEMGTIFVTTTPPGVQLRVNGRDAGTGSQRLSLQTLPQLFEGSLPGYESQTLTVAPQKGIARRIEMSLKTVGQAQKDKFGAGIDTSGGQKLVFVQLLKPIVFNVGSSRREPLRRSNETEYPAELTRSFLVSEKEVTNSEYRKFKPQHASGAVQGASLDGPGQPAVNVSWEDAARYANWLSKNEGLELAYVERDGKMVAVKPMSRGYRLPTEAEWEFAARFEAGLLDAAQPLRFAWGDSNSVPSASGNYAHEGSGLPFTIPGYIDSHLGTAPVGSFRPNAAGIFDLSGNAAEWCHDFYSVETGSPQSSRRDPLGSPEGRYHVIKGSSWRSGSLAELRFSYRDYSDKPRDDLGFRVARYVD